MEVFNRIPTYKLVEFVISLSILASLLVNKPLWLQIILIIIFIVLLGDVFIDRLKISYRIITSFYFRIKEEKRLEFVLENNIKPDVKGGENFPYKIKIKGLLETEDTEDIEAFIDTIKKELIITLKMGKNRSDNLFRCTERSIVHGYIPDIKPYLSPDLTTALDYRQIYRTLDNANDTVALSMFIESEKDTLDKLEETIIHIDSLDEEGLLYGFFIPVIRTFRKKNIVTSASIVKSTDNFFNWLSDKDKRISYTFKEKNMPITEFIYVREAGKPLFYHSYAIQYAFEKIKCNLCVVGAMGRNIKDLKHVIRDASQLTDFEKKGEIAGYCSFPDRIVGCKFVILSKQ